MTTCRTRVQCNVCCIVCTGTRWYLILECMGVISTTLYACSDRLEGCKGAMQKSPQFGAEHRHLRPWACPQKRSWLLVYAVDVMSW